MRPGALTAELVERLGSAGVTTVDPSASFVAAARARFPGIDVRDRCAELLPAAPFEVQASAWAVFARA
jgi:trans-aconitate methyltransferase